MNLYEATERYIAHLERHRSLSTHTVRAYESDLRCLKSLVGSVVAVTSLDQTTWREVLSAERARGAAPRTLRRRASTYRGFCGWLIQEGVLDENPWRNIRFDTRAPRSLPRTVPRHDLARVISSLTHDAGLNAGDSHAPTTNQRYHAVTLTAVSIMLSTGLRVSETASLRTRDYDPGSGHLRVLGKGQHERIVHVTNDLVHSLLADLQKMRDELHVEHDRILFNQHGKPLSASALRSRVAHAAAAAGVSQHVTPHMLRHSAATQLIESGVDIRYVQRLLGHARLTTTEIYTHVTDESLRRVITEADVLGRTIRSI